MAAFKWHLIDRMGDRNAIFVLPSSCAEFVYSNEAVFTADDLFWSRWIFYIAGGCDFRKGCEFFIRREALLKLTSEKMNSANLLFSYGSLVLSFFRRSRMETASGGFDWFMLCNSLIRLKHSSHSIEVVVSRLLRCCLSIAPLSLSIYIYIL